MSRPIQQRGVTMLVVMVLLSVMLLGALALARITEVGTLAAGNAQFREASLQASEIGLNTAFTQVQAIAPGAEDNAVGTGGWYWSQERPQVDGLPDVDWTATPEIVVGAYRVRYVVERVCTVVNVSNPLTECLVKAQRTNDSARDDPDKLAPLNSRQYRTTVRVTGPKDTTTFVQALLTKG